MNITARLAQELNAHPGQIDAAVALLDDGATVPFIARYRKEATGSLDDGQLRRLEERLAYLRELEDRRQTILASIEAQGKLSEALKIAIQGADSKTRLEDLYLPYKPRRRSKAQLAREAGLEPLALALLKHPEHPPEQVAAAYIDPAKEIGNTAAALDGARLILLERFAEDAELLGRLRDYLWEKAVLTSRVVKKKIDQGAKFADYFDYSEALKTIPSHRALALFRGRSEGVLTLTLTLPETADQSIDPGAAMIARRFGISHRSRAADDWLQETVRQAWRIKLLAQLELQLMQRLREAAEGEAISVFARNLQDLLLAAPAGPRPTIGLDPGLRSGVKVAVVDATGKLLATATLYPHAPHKRWDEALHQLAVLAQEHRAELISIGNGTASRETDQLAAELTKRHPELKLQKLVVSESGASVYSASELAATELPGVDVSLRGAVSIARRLQDPLAELVKIDPKSIGVGQYQHDVAQSKLARALGAVVEDCVNAVGVDVNTASPSLLARVAGLNTALANNIVAFRNQQGAFTTRRQLLKVPRLGAKTFEQAAGFLRIMNGANPLDRSAVHPESYPVVERIVKACDRSVDDLIGDSEFLKTLAPERFTDEQFGLPTVKDILSELDKPGRDPRPEFRTAVFKDGVETLQDLRPDMILEGVVSNVTNFGAFVDIGVHQDGLVHISAMADKFVKDPHDIVKAGAVVRVKVLGVDVQRNRVSLTMRLSDDSRDHRAERKPARLARQATHTAGKSKEQGALAHAFRRAKR